MKLNKYFMYQLCFLDNLPIPLSHLSGITIKLQSRAIDVYEAFEMIEDIRKVYKNERDNV